MNIAIILAGGSGSRVGGDRPKQFLEVAGKMIIEHTIEAFHQNERIDEIAIVSREDYVSDVKAMVERRGYAKVRHVLCGGKERYHSSLAALAAYKDDDDCLLLHDCVRPLVSQRIINDCLDALQEYDAVDVAVPCTDTIIQTSPQDPPPALPLGREPREPRELVIAAIPPRSTLYNVQTPQGFRRGVIARAFERAMQDPSFLPTDDCSVVFRYMPETKIHIVHGEPTNIKITYKEDLAFAETELRKKYV